MDISAGSLSWFAVLTLGLVPHAVCEQESEQKPLNVVVILADDLGWTDLGCYGSSFYDTPSLDGLAAQGRRFTNAYAACPVCSPTRASLLTGRYPQRFFATDYFGAAQPEKWKRKTPLLPAAYTPEMPLEEVTMAEVLKAEGYATFFAGKWHLGPKGHWPEDQGFDVNRGGIQRGGPYGGKRYFSPYGNERLEDGPEGEHLPARLAQEAISFMQEHREDPFLVYLSFYSVHTPLMSRADLQAKYEARAEALEDKGPVWGKEGARKSRLVQNHAVYAGMVEAMDEAVGKLLAAIDDLELRERTIVIFTSDNGGLSTSEGHPTSNLPLRAGKGWLYEGGIREPLIVRLPAVTSPGSVDATPLSSIDILPTVLAAAGITTSSKRPLDGVSFLPCLAGKDLDRGPLFWHYPHYGNQGGAPGGAVRDGDWKLIEWYGDRPLELYNLQADPGETHNLASVEQERTKSLHQRLRDWRSQVGARMPAPNPNH